MRSSRAWLLAALASGVVRCGGDGDAAAPPSATSTSTTSASGASGGAGAQGGAQSGGGGIAGGGGGSGGIVDACAPVDLSGAGEVVTLPNGCTGPSCASIGFAPLMDTDAPYHGLAGRLYCGSNERPAGHDAAGLALAKAVQPLDAQGNPSPTGKYALVAIGMSNTTQEFSEFLAQYESDPSLDPSLVLVDGALGGHATQQWIDPMNDAWDNLTMRLMQKSVTDAQVVAAWVKLAQIQPATTCMQAGFPAEPCFPADAAQLATDIRTVIDMLAARFPNLELVYLSSRIYAGYATGNLNPEPYSYQSAFSVKKLVLDQITGQAGSTGRPWLAWGPYLWADGTTPRSDGLVWNTGDLASDGVHPSVASGRAKVADMLWEFLTTDTTAREWMLAAP